MWDRFSTTEMERRLRLARDLMRERELVALLVFGNSGVNRHNHANVFWLTNHLDLHHAYLVLAADESVDPVLYIGLANHVPNAREISHVSVEWGGYDPAQRLAEWLTAVGAARGRLGLVGVNATFGMGMPYEHHQRLFRSLPQLEPIDVTRDFGSLRLVKSDEEVEWLRKAAKLTDRAVNGLREEARPGMTEDELVAVAEDAYRPYGGLPHITFLRSMPMDSPTGCVPAQNPSGRIVGKGDVVITEISASYWGYSGQIHRPLFVGAEPTHEWRRLFDAALETYEELSRAVRAGATEADAVRAAEPIREAGYEIYDDLLHGYGVDILPPLVDRADVFGGNSEATDGVRFERNMAVVLQPNPITPDERMGLQLGALTIVGDDGAASLHAVPFEPIIVGV
jgi:Xaa-Pro aminopeptidase